MAIDNSTKQRSLNPDQVLHYQQKLQYEIDAWDLQVALRQKENIIVIDARSSEAYRHEHIPNAINFPHRNINGESALKILNFQTQYITYCDGIGCNASTKSALKLAELGYKVKELIGGIDWWKRDGYPTLSEGNLNVERNHDCGCDS